MPACLAGQSRGVCSKRGVPNFFGGSPIFQGGVSNFSGAGTHPTGMHSCLVIVTRSSKLI